MPVAGPRNSNVISLIAIDHTPSSFAQDRHFIPGSNPISKSSGGGTVHIPFPRRDRIYKCLPRDPNKPYKVVRSAKTLIKRRPVPVITGRQPGATRTSMMWASAGKLLTPFFSVQQPNSTLVLDTQILDEEAASGRVDIPGH